jgi:hypothetical protein
MRMGYALLFILVLNSTARAAPQKSDRERDGLKGPVQRMVLKSGFFDREGASYKESRPLFDHGVVEYDRAGRKTKDTSTSPCDACGLVKNQYDAEGRVVRAEHFQLTDPAKVWLTIVYSYDLTGLLIQEDHYDESSTLYRKWIHKYEYDKRGNWIKQTALMQDEKLFDGDTSFVPCEVTHRAISYYEN